MRKKTINALFVHDFKFIEYKNHVYGDGQFSYSNVWKGRYLDYFTKIRVLARGVKTIDSSNIVGKYRLDGYGNKFIATESIMTPTGISKIKKISKIIDIEIQQADLVIVRLPSIQGLIACRLLRKTDKKYIIESSGSAFGSLWYRDRYLGKLFALPVHILNARAIKHAENVIYVTKKYLQSLYHNTNNTLSCSNVMIIRGSDDIIQKRMIKIENQNIDSPIKIGLVGSLDVMYKGHDIALKATAEINKHLNAELHFLGSGNNKHKWVKLAKKLGLQNKLVFDMTRNSGNDMNEWLDGIDVLLIPSKTEGMPRILVEGMSRACLIVASSAGDIPVVLDSKYIVKSGKAKEYSAKILELLADKSTQLKVVTENYMASDEFSYTRLNKKRDIFIRNIIDEVN